MLLAFEKGDLVRIRPSYKPLGECQGLDMGIIIRAIPMEDMPYKAEVLWNNGKIEKTLVGLLIKVNPQKEYL